MKFNTGKSKLLHLEHSNLWWCRLGAKRAGISFAENYLGVLVVNKAAISPSMYPCSKEGQAHVGLC